METWGDEKMQTKLNTKNVWDELEKIEQDINELKNGKTEPTIVVTERKLKNRIKKTFTAKLQVGNKSYNVKQSSTIFNGQEENDFGCGNWWFMTTTQLKSILCNNDVLIKHTSSFDGMTDCQEQLHGDFIKPSNDYLVRIIDQLERKGLMRCHYNSDEDVFKLYSCVDDYVVYVENVGWK